MKHLISIILFVFLSLSFNSCETITEPAKPEKGHISVLVVDENAMPVENVEIYIAPDSILKMTDPNGKAFFTVDVGNYFIDANVCCIGPGFINYHEPVKVEKNDTVKQELHACTACM